MGNLMSVQVKQSHIRKGASFLSSVLGVLAYGDRVSVIDDRSSGWVKVKSGSMTGFVHDSALTTIGMEGRIKPDALDFAKTHPSPEDRIASLEPTLGAYTPYTQPQPRIERFVKQIAWV